MSDNPDSRAIEAALAFVAQGYKVLAARVMTLFALIASMALWALVVVWQQNWVSFAGATGFSLLIFLPILWREGKA